MIWLLIFLPTGRDGSSGQKGRTFTRLFKSIIYHSITKIIVVSNLIVFLIRQQGVAGIAGRNGTDGQKVGFEFCELDFVG